MSLAQNFWSWFQANISRLEGTRDKNVDQSLLMELDEQIGLFCPNLVWEIGNGPDGCLELVVSAGGYREFFPDVRELIDAAPQISGWLFTAFKQPEGTDRIQFDGQTYSVDDFWFAFFGEAERGLLMLHRDGTSQSLQTAAILLLDATVGEYDAATGIDAFKLDRLPENPEQYEIYPMRELYHRFHARQSWN